MSKPLENRVVLITGAARGIGAATALALAGAGAHVLALGRSTGSLKRTVEGIRAGGGKVTPIAQDITDLAGLEEVAETVDRDFGRLDGLVANAAVLGPRSPLEQVDIAGWKEVLDVNVTGNLTLIQAFDRLLRKAPAARVVFVTSGIGSNPKAGGSAYSVSKAALDNLGRTYAAETEATPIRVNLFNPGPTRTSMRAAVAPSEDPMTLDTPEQISDKIVALCLPEVSQTGKLYNYPTKSLMDFRPPAPVA
jgi:NAD(P)-dependent dehydrogenase (short-subunit alcohol dehydrogenase family)